MKQLLLLAIIIVVIAGGWYYVTQNATGPTSAPEASETTAEDTTDAMDHTSMDEGAVQVGSDAGMEFPTSDIDGDVRTFTVTGHNFAYSMSEIRVQEGDVVTINFTSTDGFHDWVVDEFNAATARVNTDGSTSVTFVANTKGTFEYYCSVGNHRAQGMVGNLIVE